MSLYKDASLVMIPSAYKDGKLYSIRPTDGSGDFTFSRGSNLAATRVDVNGLIEKGRENLILHSNDFSNASWALNGATLTSGQSGYDGSSDAWSLISTTANGSHRIIQTFTGVSNSIVTYSVFAKSNGYDFLRIIENASTGDFATFNLSNGSVANNTGIANTAIIASVGNGWYRCSISVDGGNNTRFDIYTMETSGVTNFLGDGVSGAYIQDAQAELGLAASPYIETGASTAQAGILEDMPRLDYSGSCPALLLEPQRTNQLAHSEYLSGWNAYTPSSTIANNSAISPEGVQNACEITFTGLGNDFAYDNFYYSVTAPSVFSVYLRVASGTKLVALRTAIGNEYKAVTITTEWQRFELNITQTQASERIGIDNRATYGGSGTAGTIEVYGAQLEAGSYPTSYIPTYGSSVTRSYDNISDSTFTALPNADFTIFFEVDEWVGSQGNNYQLRFFDASGNRSIQFRNRPEGWRWLVVNDEGSGAYLNTGNYTYTKMAVRYNGTNYQLFADGSAVGSAFAAMDTAILNYFDSYPIGIMGIKQMVTFSTALTDSECIALTTL